MNPDVALAVAVAGLTLALYVAAVAYAILQVVRTPRLSTAGRGLWIAAVLTVPVAAMLVWYFLGPRPMGLRVSVDAPTFR